LNKLTTEFGELRKHLYTDDGKLRSFVNVYVNDEDIRYLGKEETPVKDGDIVSIVPLLQAGVRNFQELRRNGNKNANRGRERKVHESFERRNLAI